MCDDFRKIICQPSSSLTLSFHQEKEKGEYEEVEEDALDNVKIEAKEEEEEEVVISDSIDTTTRTDDMNRSASVEDESDNMNDEEKDDFEEVEVADTVVTTDTKVGLGTWSGEFMVKTTQKTSFMPIHMTARLGFDNFVRCLVDSGCNISSKTKAGETTLMISARYGHKDSLRVLTSAVVLSSPGLIHILPDVFGDLTSPCLNEHQWGDLPFPGFAAMMTSLLTLIMDSLATGYYKRQTTNGNIKESGNQQVDVHTHATHGHTQGSLPISSSSSTDKHSLWLIHHRVMSQVLELGTVVHSIIIGISLGISESPSTIKPLIAALCFHQLFEGMRLGNYISQAEFKRRAVVIIVLFVSLTTPIDAKGEFSHPKVFLARSSTTGFNQFTQVLLPKKDPAYAEVDDQNTTLGSNLKVADQANLVSGNSSCVYYCPKGPPVAKNILLSHYNRVVVKDWTWNVICYGAQLFIPTTSIDPHDDLNRLNIIQTLVLDYGDDFKYPFGEDNVLMEALMDQSKTVAISEFINNPLSLWTAKNNDKEFDEEKKKKTLKEMPSLQYGNENEVDTFLHIGILHIKCKIRSKWELRIAMAEFSVYGRLTLFSSSKRFGTNLVGEGEADAGAPGVEAFSMTEPGHGPTGQRE